MSARVGRFGGGGPSMVAVSQRSPRSPPCRTITFTSMLCFTSMFRSTSTGEPIGSDWIEIADHHLLDDAILLEDRHDDSAGLIGGAAGAAKHARQRRADGRDHLLDALPGSVQHLDLQRLGDELRRHHALAELPRGRLMANGDENARQVAADRIDDGELQSVVRLRLQLQFMREGAALVEKHLVRQARAQRPDAHRTALQRLRIADCGLRIVGDREPRPPT